MCPYGNAALLLSSEASVSLTYHRSSASVWHNAISSSRSSPIPPASLLTDGTKDWFEIAIWPSAKYRQLSNVKGATTNHIHKALALLSGVRGAASEDTGFTAGSVCSVGFERACWLWLYILSVLTMANKTKTQAVWEKHPQSVHVENIKMLMKVLIIAVS